jgi:DNA repair exonuclease SbcCD ATPase subunit
MAQLKEWNKQIKIDIAELRKREDEFGGIINETQTRFDTLLSQLKSSKTKLNNLDVVKFIVSEEGVKSFIVKKILKLLNGKLAYYLKKLDAPGLCTFNEYFEETIVNDKGQECSYHNFSSGEQKRVDLAMLFTFMDIRRLQGDVSLNISFYDEILDTSLDDKGIELFIEIIKNRIEKYNEAAYIISHKMEAIKSATNDVIYLEKKNGFTRRIDYGTEI